MNNRGQIQELKELAQTIEEKQVPVLDEVESAWDNRYMKVYNVDDVFYLLCSLNLLNSAIKEKQFKKVIHYGGIKNNVARIVSYLISNPDKQLVEEIWVNPEEGPCAYIVSNSFQFTFHNIPVNDVLKSFMDSDKNHVKPWEGIRLQLIASDLFQLSSNQRFKNQFVG